MHVSEGKKVQVEETASVTAQKQEYAWKSLHAGCG